MNLTRIIHQNEFLRKSILTGASIDALMSTWDSLQLLCAYYINSELPGFPSNVAPSGKPSRSLVQRLKGKHGRFRGNLSGKRVDFSGRTVISPDPNLRIDNVGVPLAVAKILTYPERVNEYNIEKLRSMVRNGPDTYPGANFVQSGNAGDKRFLKFGNRELIAEGLKLGDIVERHLIDEDVVLFNRQPSLHRMSIMCHRAKILPYRTFRFNECCCAPYNADFDGDEMNLHVPQTEEARAEAATLMHVLSNLLNARNGEPLIACTQDFLTGAYLLTRRYMFFDRGQFCQLVSYAGINERVDLPPPAIIKPLELWTGKQLFSLIVKPAKESKVLINVETKGRNYKGNTHFDIEESWIHFINSEMVSGSLDKKILGDSKSTMFYQIIKNYGAKYAAEVMARVARVTCRWLMTYGFSIGINDVQPSESLMQKKALLLAAGYKKCEMTIEEFNSGKLESHPGCTAEQTLEAILNKELSQIRTDAGNACMAQLHYLNVPLIMVNCGSKGSNLNIGQMVSCVGQQTVAGSRISNGFVQRTLPHFPIMSRTPAAKGFVQNSFYTGLTATEFFFHTMAGREGLVDTAVKTAETGYMQRRLMKALEDLTVHYDYTIRNSVNTIVQFNYGDDGLDPHAMEADEGRPFNLPFTFAHVKNITGRKVDEKPLLPEQIRQLTAKFISENYVPTSEESSLFSKNFAEKELVQFTNSVADDIEIMLNQVNDRMKQMTPSDRKAWLKVMEKTSNRVYPSQIDAFFQLLKTKYSRMKTEPGTAVGALAGQSIGEPGTQMTLKTFHFAGIASMRMTLGVPRIVEIINATKSMNTPVIYVKLINKNDEQAARVVKGRIEKTELGQVAKYIREVYDAGICYIEIKLNRTIIESLHLEINNQNVVKSIIATPKLGIKEKFITVDKNKIRVYAPKNEREKLFHNIQFLKRALPKVIVSGIPTINRAIITKNEQDKTSLELLLEGTNLLPVFGTPGVNTRDTVSNNILEIESVLGIEAARVTIMNEIHSTMKQYGISLDKRHVMLLADVMTFKGEILGITRHGISKMKDSVLMLASFERTTDHLFDAGAHSRKDDIEGVSECIIMGIPIGLGTGLFKVLQDVRIAAKPPRRSLFTGMHTPTTHSSLQQCPLSLATRFSGVDKQ